MRPHRRRRGSAGTPREESRRPLPRPECFTHWPSLTDGAPRELNGKRATQRASEVDGMRRTPKKAVRCPAPLDRWTAADPPAVVSAEDGGRRDDGDEGRKGGAGGAEQSRAEPPLERCDAAATPTAGTRSAPLRSTQLSSAVVSTALPVSRRLRDDGSAPRLYADLLLHLLHPAPSPLLPQHCGTEAAHHCRRRRRRSRSNSTPPPAPLSAARRHPTRRPQCCSRVQVSPSARCPVLALSSLPASPPRHVVPQPSARDDGAGVSVRAEQRAGAVHAVHALGADREVPVVGRRRHDGAAQVHLLLRHVHQGWRPAMQRNPEPLSTRPRALHALRTPFSRPASSRSLAVLCPRQPPSTTSSVS